MRPGWGVWVWCPERRKCQAGGLSIPLLCDPSRVICPLWASFLPCHTVFSFTAFLPALGAWCFPDTEREGAELPLSWMCRLVTHGMWWLVLRGRCLSGGHRDGGGGSAPLRVGDATQGQAWPSGVEEGRPCGPGCDGPSLSAVPAGWWQCQCAGQALMPLTSWRVGGTGS